MPPLVGMLAAAIATAAGATAATAAVIAAVVNIVAAVAMAVAIRAMTPKPKNNTSGLSDLLNDARARATMIRSSAEARRVIYGRTLVSGPMLYAGATGTNNSYLHIIVGLAGHEVDAIEDVYIGDEVYDDPRIAAYVRVKTYTGTAMQETDPDLLAECSEITSSDRWLGIAYVYVRLLWNSEIWLGGIPNIRCLIRGKKVWDPRSNLTAWTDNAALCQLDYLMSEHGMSAPVAQIHQASWVAAANVCDERVATADGGDMARYAANGCFQLDERPIDVMEDLLSASAGTIVYTQGQYRGYAASYDEPTVTLCEDDLRADMGYVAKPPRREQFNVVKGIFLDPMNYWQATDFPEWRGAAYITEDGEELTADIQLPYTVSSRAAQRLAKLHLERQRSSLTVTFPAKYTALKVATWDTVALAMPRLWFPAKTFRVLSSVLSPEGGVDLSLKEESAAVYAWDAEETTYTSGTASTVLRPWLVQYITGIVARTGPAYAVSGAYQVYVTWVQATDPFVASGGSIQIESKYTTQATWYYAGSVAGDKTEFYLTGVYPGTMLDLRVRGVNSLGAPSAWVYRYGLVISATVNTAITTLGQQYAATGNIAQFAWLTPRLSSTVIGTAAMSVTEV